MAAFKGLKGGQPTPPQSLGDTLFSDDILEVVGGISEGPIKGPVNGLRSIFINDTPLVDSSGTPSIVNFDLHFHKGQNPASPIKPNLGATGSAIAVNVAMDTNVPIVRSGQQVNIDLIAVRIVVNRLLYTHPQYGEAVAAATWKIEVKPHSAPSWTNVGTVEPPNAVTEDTNVTRYYELNNGTSVNSPEARDVFIRGTEPLSSEVSEADSLWFNSANGYRPYAWDSTNAVWKIPSSLTYTANDGGNYSYWQWYESGQRRRCYLGFNTTPPATMGQYDLWITPTGVLNNSEDTAYSWNGSSWSNGLKYGLPTIEAPGDFRVIGKTSSPYVRECLIRVEKINEPYDIRVTKTTPPNNAYYYGDISFESFVELTQRTYTFNDLAAIHMTVRASDQLSGQPKITADSYGRIIRVPSNYDAVAKTYDGVWDGTWKMEYTDNPAFIINDLVSNDRYGVSAYRPVTLDKWAVYAFGQHCDAHGFTYNEWITEPRDVEDAIDYICGIAGGRYIDLGNGFATILFDADDQPAVALFAEENVADGLFSYSFTDVNTRHNDITVSYVDPITNWAENRRRIFDQDAINKFGRIKDEFIAVGCISETEAIKRARLRLITAQTERTIVSFKTNRQGIYLSNYDVILIADPDSKFGISGRIKTVENANTITLRDAINLEAGLTYNIDITQADGSVFTSTIVASIGTTKRIRVAASLPALPDQAVFAISCEETIGMPKAFRITSISLQDSDPDHVSVSAIEVNRTKWAYVDAPVETNGGGGSGFVDKSLTPPSNLTVVPTIKPDGLQDAQLAWTPSTSTYVKMYRVYQSVGGNVPIIVAETRDSVYNITDLRPSTYRWTVVGVSYEGRESLPITLEHTVAGVVRPVSSPTNLRLVNGATPFVFAERSPTFAWDASPDAFFDHYRFQIVDTSTNTVMFDTDTENLQFTYDYETNKTNFGGVPSRTFQVRVAAIDRTGSQSSFLALTVSNPPPSAPTATVLSSDLFRLLISYAKTADRDWAGALVYTSTTAGFTPGPLNLIYDGPNTSCEDTISEGETKYVRIAFYDDFDKTISGYSPQVTMTGAGLRPGTVSFDKLATDLRTVIETTEATAIEQASRIESLEGEQYGSWSVKIQSQGRTGGGTPYKVVSGFGLSQSDHGGEVTSDFIVAADRFSVIPAYNPAVPTLAAPVFIVGTRGGIASVGIKGDMFLDGSITATALNVATLSALSANVGTVTAGVLKSSDNKFVIDLDNRTITISD